MTSSNRRSLNARKMEKMMIGVIEKGYSRQPALTYPIANPMDPNDPMCHLGFIRREFRELADELLEIMRSFDDDEVLGRIDAAMDEVADVSNTLDFCFERLMIFEDELHGKKD